MAYETLLSVRAATTALSIVWLRIFLIANSPA
jgi:hypothetical protein